MSIQLKSISKYLILLSLSLTIFSCEKVIDLPLEETGQKVVIEASTSNFLGDSYVLLSRTATLYGKDVFEKVNNGTVQITDKDGVTTVFSEDGTGKGRYIHPTFVVTPNNEYHLEVTIDGNTYSAKSSTQSLTNLNFIYTKRILNEGFTPGGQGIGKDSLNLLFMGYSDNVNESNHYRFNIYTNEKRNKRINISDDKVSNGQEVSGPFFSSYEPGDSIRVEMINMDQANYTYFYSKANTSNSGPFSATPANPVSNIDNDALGYFGAYLKDTMSLVIPD